MTLAELVPISGNEILLSVDAFEKDSIKSFSVFLKYGAAFSCCSEVL